LSDPRIRPVPADDPLEESARVISEAFAQVAVDFQLTEQNCPTSPAFQTAEKLRESREKGLEVFGMFEGAGQTGAVAIERAGEDVFYLQRLAVIPSCRNAGRGSALVDFALETARSGGAKVVSLGMIAADTRLKDWYRGLGFVERETRRIESLPFEVTFMEIAVDLPHMPGSGRDL
jgi:diamine N-acetyltransferase